MAAGRGMRMMPLTDLVPKAMAPFSGTTLIADGIQKIRKHISNVHITVGYKGAMLAKHVIEHDVLTLFNTEGKGNAWWVYNTLMKYVDEPVYVLTCDNVVDLQFDEIAEDYFKKNAPACMVVPVKPVEGLDGDYIFKENKLVSLITRDKTSDIYCSGIQVLNPAKVNRLTQKTESFNDLWNNLIKKKQLYCSDVLPIKWCAVDSIDQLDVLNKSLFKK
tara:strand:+ start:7341 stop:7994 length:654 start_codon:yes stop_codon:yes gene_type:complete